jgi:acetyltransferase-like isoleucine patch superfamily enzyme
VCPVSKSGDFEEVADRVLVHRQAILDVERFEAGPGTVINAHARVFGTAVHIGREGWIDEYATIGGGSAYDPGAYLTAGRWCALGNYSQVNLARGVTLGDEVGVGIGSRIFTHGAYLSEWEGFPVSFAPVSVGSRVWLPNAQVNPGVTIGDDVVAAAGAIITKDVPANSLVVGAPATVRGAAKKPVLSEAERLGVLTIIAAEIEDLTAKKATLDAGRGTIQVDGATFDLDERYVTGPATKVTETARNQLRRRGIRFAVEVHDGAYRPWPELAG